MNRSPVIIRAGLFMGIVAGVLFSYPPGINIPIYTACFLIAGSIVLTPQRFTRNMLFAIPAQFFAMMLSITSAPYLNFINYSLLAGSLLIITFFAADRQFNLRGLFTTVYYAITMEWLRNGN